MPTIADIKLAVDNNIIAKTAPSSITRSAVGTIIKDLADVVDSNGNFIRVGVTQHAKFNLTGNILIGYASDIGFKLAVSGKSAFSDNLLIGSSTDNGARLQVASVLAASTGTTYNSGSNILTGTSNTTGASIANRAGFFSCLTTRSAGSNPLTNFGVYAQAAGGQSNFAIGVGDPNFTGFGYFYQSANNTTIIGGGGSESIRFGPDNRIRLIATEVVVNSVITTFGVLFKVIGASFSSTTGQSVQITPGSSMSGVGGTTQTAVQIIATAATQTTGTAHFFSLEPTINLNGNATAVIVRGFYYNPTLTNIVGLSKHIAFQNVAGDIILNSTSGNTIIGTTSDTGEKFQVTGSAKVTAALTVGTTLKSGQPSVNGAGAVKMGKVLTATTVALEGTKYLELEVDGVLYYIPAATVTP